MHAETLAVPPPGDLAGADLQACVAMMQGGSKTFFAASRLLPARVRAGAIALYAFCRVADDLVDQPGGGLASLRVLQHRLDRIYADDRLDARPFEHQVATVRRFRARPGWSGSA